MHSSQGCRVHTYLENQLIMLIKALQICQDGLQGLLQALILLLLLHLLNQQVSKVVLQSSTEMRLCIWHLPLPGYPIHNNAVHGLLAI